MSYQFSMERVLYNLHHQVCSYALRKTTSYGRNLAEKFVLILALCGFGALLLAHLSFVYRGNTNIPLSCLPSIPGFTKKFDITHIRLLVDNNVESFAYIQSNIGDNDNGNNIVTSEDGRHNGYCKNENDVSESEVGSGSRRRACSSSSSSSSGHPGGVSATDPLYSYSHVMGYLYLPPHIVAEQQRQLRVQNVMISPTDVKCFGEPFLQKLIFHIIGPNTVMINWLLALQEQQQEEEEESLGDDNTTAQLSSNKSKGGSGKGGGFAYNPRTDTMIDLNQYNNNNNDRKRDGKKQRKEEKDSSSSSRRIRIWRWYIMIVQQQIVSKLALVLKTSFLFFITTTLVSFTLRETQERMLDFTHQLQAHVRSHRPVAQLVTTHLVENLVFVPIMVGMMFFLNEFYRGDKILAFTVVSLVWICEVFSVVSLRSSQGIHFFPRIFFLLFSLFHFYLFSFPFGFSYTALASTICFMTHSMLFFWHRYELPAVAHGLVTLEHPRMGIAATATSPSSIPSLESSRNSNDPFRPLNFGIPAVNLPPRHIARTASISRPASSGGLSGNLFHRGGDDDGDESSSYMYFLEGEVVVQRQRPTTPGSVSGSQIQSTGSIGDNSASNQITNHGISSSNSHAHSTSNNGLGRVPDRIVMLPPVDQHPQDDDVSWDHPIPTAGHSHRQQLHSGPQTQQATTMLLGGDGNGSPAHFVDPPETSALHAILQQTHETPRTDNLSSQQQHSQSRVRAAPVFPSLSSSTKKAK